MWTVVAVDVSLSMPMRGYWVAAHQDALALVKELQDAQSRHQLKAVIAFSELARSVPEAELSSMEWDYVYGSNLAAALQLALEELDGEPGRVVVLSDMEITAHTTDHGEAFFSYPPSPETAERTVRAVEGLLSGMTELEVRRYRGEFDGSHPGVDTLLFEVIRLGGTVSDIVVPSP